jgi:hypothetical protein
LIFIKLLCPITLKTPHTLSVFTNLKQLHFLNVIPSFNVKKVVVANCFAWILLRSRHTFGSLNNSVSWTINSDHRICSLAAANN